jgi:hypothetical protein
MTIQRSEVDKGDKEGGDKRSDQGNSSRCSQIYLGGCRQSTRNVRVQDILSRSTPDSPLIRSLETYPISCLSIHGGLPDVTARK